MNQLAIVWMLTFCTAVTAQPQSQNEDDQWPQWFEALQLPWPMPIASCPRYPRCDEQDLDRDGQPVEGYQAGAVMR